MCRESARPGCRVQDQLQVGHGSERGRGSGRLQRGITNRHEGLGVHAGLGDPDGVDSKDPHLVEDALDHVGGLVGGLREDLEVQLHPALGALLLPLQEVSWQPPMAERSGGSHREAWGHRSVGGRSRAQQVT